MNCRKRLGVVLAFGVSESLMQPLYGRIQAVFEIDESALRPKPRGANYELAWEVVADPLGELAGHIKGTYGHGGAFESVGK